MSHIAAIVRLNNSFFQLVTTVENKKNLHNSLTSLGVVVESWGDGEHIEDAINNGYQNLFKSLDSQDAKWGLNLSMIETVDLINHIEDYRKLDLRKCLDNDRLEALRKILKIHFTSFVTYDQDTLLYRARKLKAEGDNVRVFLAESNVWCPPTEYTDDKGNKQKSRIGRLNSPGETLLYTTLDPGTLAEEIRLKPGDVFCMIKYRIKKGHNLYLSQIGMNDYEHYLLHNKQNIDKSTWTKEAVVNYHLMNDFLRNEFTRDVGEGTEYLYQTSNLIAKHYYDPGDIDGFIYPSVAFKTGFNVAIKKQAVERSLEFLGLRVYKLDSYNQDGSGKLIPAPLWSDKIVNGQIEYTYNKPFPGYDANF